MFSALHPPNKLRSTRTHTQTHAKNQLEVQMVHYSAQRTSAQADFARASSFVVGNKRHTRRKETRHLVTGTSHTHTHTLQLPERVCVRLFVEYKLCSTPTGLCRCCSCCCESVALFLSYFTWPCVCVRVWRTRRTCRPRWGVTTSTLSAQWEMERKQCEYCVRAM